MQNPGNKINSADLHNITSLHHSFFSIWPAWPRRGPLLFSKIIFPCQRWPFLKRNFRWKLRRKGIVNLLHCRLILAWTGRHRQRSGKQMSRDWSTTAERGLLKKLLGIELGILRPNCLTKPRHPLCTIYRPCRWIWWVRALWWRDFGNLCEMAIMLTTSYSYLSAILKLSA